MLIVAFNTIDNYLEVKMQHLNITYKQNDNIKLVLKNTCVANPSKNWLAAYYFQIQNLKGEIIGRCDLRIGKNELIYYSGNIGYTILDEYRGNNYASQAITMLIDLAKKCKMDFITITCAPKNIASRRSIEKAGGTLIEIAKVPKNHPIRIKNKQTKVCIYTIDCNLLVK